MSTCLGCGSTVDSYDPALLVHEPSCSFKFSHVPFVRDRRPRFRLLGRQISTGAHATGAGGVSARPGFLPERGFPGRVGVLPEVPAMSPQRIQLSRTKGYRKPEGAVVVARPSRWGNPFKVGETYHRGWNNPLSTASVTVRDRAHAVRLYRAWLFNARRSEDLVPELCGRDLACWCPLDQPCHADVLLELANGRRPPVAGGWT